MKAWRLYGPGGRLAYEDIDMPTPRAGGVVVRMEASPVLSYMRQVIDGSLGYALPGQPFTPGTNGIGIVEARGSDVYHLAIGDRVSLNPHHLVDERVTDPAQLLIGLTAIGSARFAGLPPEALRLQENWPDGVFAEYAQVPAACVTRLTGLEDTPAEQLAAIGKLAVPYGGLLKGRFQPGEIALVNGASGYFGSGGVLVALAMGASAVVAAGRDAAALESVAEMGGPLVRPVALSGDASIDAKALRDAADGAIDFVLDLVGRAKSAASTLAALRSLRRGGRLVLMGSVAEPLPIEVGEMLANDWSIAGNFMYPKDAPARIAAMIASGTLDLDAVSVRCFPLAELEAAMDAAAKMRGLDFVAVATACRE